MRLPAWVWLRLRRPLGARIVHSDGTESPCRVKRAPTRADGCAMWLAIPPPGVRFRPMLGDVFLIDVLPPRTNVGIGAHVQRNENWPS